MRRLKACVCFRKDALRPFGVPPLTLFFSRSLNRYPVKSAWAGFASDVKTQGDCKPVAETSGSHAGHWGPWWSFFSFLFDRFGPCGCQCSALRFVLLLRERELSHVMWAFVLFKAAKLRLNSSGLHTCTVRAVDVCFLRCSTV